MSEHPGQATPSATAIGGGGAGHSRLPLKALTVRQPYAQLIVDGVKRYETRDWRPLTIDVGGTFAIHAAVTIEGATCARFGYDEWTIPAGVVVAVVRLLEVIPTSEGPHLADPVERDRELAMGDWGPDRWAWRLEVVERLTPPVPAVGRLGLWEWRP